MFRKTYQTRKKSTSSLNVKTTPADKHKIMAAFDDHYDDSSDEEEINAELEAYDPNRSWRDLRNDLQVYAKNPLMDDNLLSFAAHTAANQFYHSRDISSIYYPLKKKMLQPDYTAMTASQSLHARASAALQAAADQSIHHMQQFLELSGQEKISIKHLPQVFAQIKNEFLLQADKELANALSVLIESVKSKKHGKREFEDMKGIVKLLTDSFVNVFTQKMNIVSDARGREKITIDLHKMLDDKLNEIITKFKFTTLKNSSGKRDALELLGNYQGPYQHLVIKLKIFLESSAANGRVDTMLRQKINDHQDELSCALLRDLAAIKEGKRANAVLTSSESSFFSQYFAWNRESVADELSRNFSVSLLHKLTDAVDSFRRPTLLGMHEFESSNPYQFYANLRLSNRSQKRQISNCKSQFFKHDSSARSWKLNPESRYAVIEMQHLTNETLGRRDLVLGVANYEKIYQDMLAIKQRLVAMNCHIDDKTIARWIRAAFSGESLHIDNPALPESERESMEEMITCVAYLIHGCEAARNIAMIFIIPMLLDLVIETDDWTLSEALTGKVDGVEMGLKAKLMPMAPEGAVAAARSLESTYHSYVPHAYHYPGNQDFDGSGYKMRKEELVKYEARIVRDWIYLKYGRDIVLTNDDAAAWLVEAISGASQVWFGMPDNARVPRRS